MAQKKTTSHRKQLSNNKLHDSGSKVIFGNAELCSQFLRNYMDIPLFKNIRAEDIIVARVTASLLRHLDVPGNEVMGFTEQVKENKMAELFENFVNDVDMSSLYKIALERTKWRAMKAGEAKGWETGLAEGEAHFAELTRLLLEAKRWKALHIRIHMKNR